MVMRRPPHVKSVESHSTWNGGSRSIELFMRVMSGLASTLRKGKIFHIMRLDANTNMVKKKLRILVKELMITIVTTAT